MQTIVMQTPYVVRVLRDALLRAGSHHAQEQATQIIKGAPRDPHAIYLVHCGDCSSLPTLSAPLADAVLSKLDECSRVIALFGRFADLARRELNGRASPELIECTRNIVQGLAVVATIELRIDPTAPGAVIP